MPLKTILGNYRGTWTPSWGFLLYLPFLVDFNYNYGDSHTRKSAVWVLIRASALWIWQIAIQTFPPHGPKSLSLRLFNREHMYPQSSLFFPCLHFCFHEQALSRWIAVPFSKPWYLESQVSTCIFVPLCTFWIKYLFIFFSFPMTQMLRISLPFPLPMPSSLLDIIRVGVGKHPLRKWVNFLIQDYWVVGDQSVLIKKELPGIKYLQTMQLTKG